MNVTVKNNDMKKCNCKTIKVQNIQRLNQFNNVRHKIGR